MRSLLTPHVRLRQRFRQNLLASRISSSVSSISSSENDPQTSSTASNSSKNLTLTLTPAEDYLFSFIEYIQRVYAPPTQLRVAGGWVRDKLRGTASADIDIALDNLKGANFATFITKFQQSRRLPRSSVGIVKANANKSKHLEVATVTINGATIDFVHLRAEQYKTDCRVPDVKFATPAEDASRRDLTINALFYNLHTKEVEDFTGKGVQDLRDGIVRTPREPIQTFLDDPLRVLRALRFACEFQFTLDPTLEKTLLEQREVIETMQRKVSRERIGIEVRKMLSGNDPARAFMLLRKFDLLDLIFNDTVGNMGERTARKEGETTEFKYAPRDWTDSIQTRASHYLQYLQRSRLALAKCQISNVEASAAILTPLFLEKLPKIIFDDFSRLVVDDMTEEEILSSSLDFLNRQENLAAALDSNEIIEMLKVHLKWPKPAGKRVAMIIEAIALYPERKCNGLETSKEEGRKYWVQHFLWLAQYHSVLTPVVTILAADWSFNNQNIDQMEQTQEDETVKKYLEMANACVKTDEPITKPSQNGRLDGKTVQTRLGPDARNGIARAIRILQVWEKIYPNASVEDEVAFLDRMASFLRD